MKYRFQKSVHILNDLITYLHQIGSADFHIDMRLRKNVSVCMISAPVPNMSEDEVKRLKDTLNTPRQREVEQNFWGLSGEADTDPELSLVGMMVDEAMVDYTNGLLTIVVKRLEDQL